jgi:hypothetical protein
MEHCLAAGIQPHSLQLAEPTSQIDPVSDATRNMLSAWAMFTTGSIRVHNLYLIAG